MALVRGICAVLLLMAAGDAAAGTAKPDLVVKTVSVVQQGELLRVTTVVRNVGTAATPASHAAFMLGSKRIGIRRVRALRPGERTRTSSALDVPRSLASGGYFLRVCADAPHRIAEERERNNCRTAVRRVWAGDSAPPRFDGLARATTCLPGPIGGGRSSRYTLGWEAAVDDTTPSPAIVYDVYHATTPDREDLGSPTYTTEAGATSFTTPLLTSDEAHYFVVRARDRAGNRDTNRVEREGVNICD
jgi:hypothetical protein